MTEEPLEARLAAEETPPARAVAEASREADGAPETRVDCDVVIVGGGLVGSALAVALAPLALKIVLVEAHDPSRLQQPSFDARVTALANGSARILRALGLGDALDADAEPILSIHVSERGRFGAARIRAAEEGVRALGYTIENSSLGRALWEKLRAAERCRVLAPARLVGFETDAAGVLARAECGGGAVAVRAKLLVAADGARSRVRDLLGIEAREDRYGQKAVILNCTTSVPHRGAAFERFMPGGPLAMLPLKASRTAVIWTLPAPEADAAAALPDLELGAALQSAFGHRLGRILRVGARTVHALGRVRSNALGAPRVVLIGNAAVSLHPVAGQGFNLALRDVAALAEIVAAEHAKPAGDVGAEPVRARYAAWRAGDQRKVAWFTHGLVGLFGRDMPGLGAARGLGLVAFDLLPGAKAALARHTMGIAGTLPRLARGLPLT
ncbi:MAG TPA: 2-octaprenyl-6-methoxyphenyl hydroxylase [Gammaproteobacteria bacterium]|nr:2-octaprenyl-6-methoxyphenyl hydroxylase [Gammaproteobacteria bacterium]